MNTNLEAILWVLLSTALFTIVFAAAKFADGAVGTFQILLLRYIGAFATVWVLAVMTGGLGRCKSRVPLLHFARSVLGCSAAAAITWASARMPVADASAIGILYGVITVLLGLCFLNERVGLWHWSAVFVSLNGAAIVVLAQGALQNTVILVPVVVALFSAVFMASEGLMIRILSQTENAMAMMLYISGFGILLMILPAFWEWRAVSASVVVICLALGPLSVIAQYCTIRGYRLAPLSVVGPVDYSWLVFAMILGAVAFKEYPSLPSFAGGLLIFAGGWMLTRSRTRI